MPPRVKNIQQGFTAKQVQSLKEPWQEGAVRRSADEIPDMHEYTIAALELLVPYDPQRILTAHAFPDGSAYPATGAEPDQGAKAGWGVVFIAEQLRQGIELKGGQDDKETET